jgi:hypothetical protein
MEFKKDLKNSDYTPTWLSYEAVKKFFYLQ